MTDMREELSLDNYSPCEVEEKWQGKWEEDKRSEHDNDQEKTQINSDSKNDSDQIENPYKKREFHA